MIEPSTVVRNKALVAGAGQWLRDLPDLVARLAGEWGLTIGRRYDDATEALVLAVDLLDGTPAVLKLMVPRSGDAAEHEITVLRLADGVGCVRLLRGDAPRGALLLERLGPSLHDLGLPLAQRHEILCATASALWRPAAGYGLPTGAEKGRWLAERIASSWVELDHPCSERAIEQAVECAVRRVRAHDDERSVLVHGDVHEWNVLQAGDGFKLIDPDGLLAEAEYDLGILMREDPDDLLAGGSVAARTTARAHWLATRCGLDAAAIWEWGVVERVSTGLLATRIDLQPVGRQMLAVADQLATG
ncbi:MAG: aminoglycoside phosphotransferase family protein [Ilumatobacteraceae bacterium]